MKNTDNRVKPYGQRLTTIIIFVWSLIILALGLSLIIVGIVALFDERTARFLTFAPILAILIGFSVVVFGSLIYVIGALSKDVYNILFYNEYMTNENDNFHRYMGKRIKEIEENQQQIKSGIARISGLVDKDERYK